MNFLAISINEKEVIVSQTQKNIGQTVWVRLKWAVLCLKYIHLAAMGFGNHIILKSYINYPIKCTSYIYFWNVIKFIVKNNVLL